MSNRFRAVIATAASLASLLAIAQEPTPPGMAAASETERASEGQEAGSPRESESKPILWDELNPKAIDDKARNQHQHRALPKPMPAEVK